MESLASIKLRTKAPGPDCSCRKKCMHLFSEEDKQSLISRIYGADRPKNEQDTFLMGLIERHDVARHRPSLTSDKPRLITSSFKYFALQQGNRRTEVCRKAFSSLHAVSNKAIARLTKLVESAQAPMDMRGRHQNRGNALDPRVLSQIDQHVRSWEVSETLTVRKLHENFLGQFPELNGIVKYKFFLRRYRQAHPMKPEVDRKPRGRKKAKGKGREKS